MTASRRGPTLCGVGCFYFVGADRPKVRNIYGEVAPGEVLKWQYLLNPSHGRSKTTRAATLRGAVPSKFGGRKGSFPALFADEAAAGRAGVDREDIVAHESEHARRGRLVGIEQCIRGRHIPGVGWTFGAGDPRMNWGWTVFANDAGGQGVWEGVLEDGITHVLQHGARHSTSEMALRIPTHSGRETMARSEDASGIGIATFGRVARR